MEIGKKNPYLYGKGSVGTSSAKNIYDLAIDQYNDGMKNEAENNFSKAISLDGSDAYAYYNRGTFYLLEKKYKPAIDDFNRALRLNHRFPEAIYNLACAHIQIFSFREGMQNLKRAIDYDKRYASLAKIDPDFDSVKFKKEFQEITMVI